jgi:4'-phosphopantetheinyl transferase
LFNLVVQPGCSTRLFNPIVQLGPDCQAASGYPDYLHITMQDETHVWYADLNVDETGAGRLIHLLDIAERARAQRFAFPYLRTRFVAAHALARQVLGKYLDIAPECVSYAYAPQGKPRLSNGGEIRFNLSHSADIAALAIVPNREIGIDIEKTREITDMLSLARRFFSQPEIDWLLATPPDQQTSAFFTCWTAKEAYLKARGDGLSFPLDRFQALPVTGSERLRLAVYGEPAESERWCMTRFHIESATGALAVEGVNGRPIFQKWTG